jgi:hypothetical protein
MSTDSTSEIKWSGSTMINLTSSKTAISVYLLDGTEKILSLNKSMNRVSTKNHDGDKNYLSFSSLFLVFRNMFYERSRNFPC